MARRELSDVSFEAHQKRNEAKGERNAAVASFVDFLHGDAQTGNQFGWLKGELLADGNSKSNTEMTNLFNATGVAMRDKSDRRIIALINKDSDLVRQIESLFIPKTNTSDEKIRDTLYQVLTAVQRIVAGVARS